MNYRLKDFKRAYDGKLTWIQIYDAKEQIEDTYEGRTCVYYECSVNKHVLIPRWIAGY